jgi:UDP-N-acetylglucosamine:LPS N-acetylglucosamine transferase
MTSISLTLSDGADAVSFLPLIDLPICKIKLEKIFQKPPFAVLEIIGRIEVERDQRLVSILLKVVKSLPIKYGSFSDDPQFRYSCYDKNLKLVYSHLSKKIDEVSFFGKSNTAKMYETYNEIFKEELNPSHKHHLFVARALPDYLRRHIFLLGGSSNFLYKNFLQNFEDSQISFRSIELLAKVKIFFKSCENQISIKTIPQKYRAVILTSQIKGGHESVARSLEEGLLSQGYEVAIIYADRLDKDPLEKWGILYKGRKANWELMRNELLIPMKDVMSGEVLSLIYDAKLNTDPGKLFRKTVQKIRIFNPSLLFSTCAHDNEHHKIALHMKLKLNVLLADFFVHNVTDQMHPKKMRIFSQNDSSIGKSFPFQRDIAYIGNCANSCFFNKPSFSTLNRIREKYGIDVSDKVILVTFGSSPVEELIDSACRELSKPKLNELIGPHKILIVGAADLHFSFSSNMIALPKIPIDEMAVLFHLSDCIVGKPGGAISSEVEATGVDLLGFAMYQWERPNLEYLRAKGLGDIVCWTTLEDCNLIDLIPSSIERTDKRRKEGYTAPPRLINMLPSLIPT